MSPLELYGLLINNKIYFFFRNQRQIYFSNPLRPCDLSSTTHSSSRRQVPSWSSSSKSSKSCECAQLHICTCNPIVMVMTRLEVNCTVRKSLPKPSLLWYINRSNHQHHHNYNQHNHHHHHHHYQQQGQAFSSTLIGATINTIYSPWRPIHNKHIIIIDTLSTVYVTLIFLL